MGCRPGDRGAIRGGQRPLISPTPRPGCTHPGGGEEGLSFTGRSPSRTLRPAYMDFHVSDTGEGPVTAFGLWRSSQATKPYGTQQEAGLPRTARVVRVAASLASQHCWMRTQKKSEDERPRTAHTVCGAFFSVYSLSRFMRDLRTALHNSLTTGTRTGICATVNVGGIARRRANAAVGVELRTSEVATAAPPHVALQRSTTRCTQQSLWDKKIAGCFRMMSTRRLTE